HVDLLGLLDGRRHTRVVPHGAQADVQVQLLPQGDVEAADAAADGRLERPLDGDLVRGDGIQGGLRQPVAHLLVRLLAGQDLHPGDLALAVVGRLDRGVEDALGCPPDVRTRAVALDERDDRVVGDVQLAVGADGDRLAVPGDGGLPGHGLRSQEATYEAWGRRLRPRLPFPGSRTPGTG